LPPSNQNVRCRATAIFGTSTPKRDFGWISRVAVNASQQQEEFIHTMVVVVVEQVVAKQVSCWQPVSTMPFVQYELCCSRRHTRTAVVVVGAWCWITRHGTGSGQRFDGLILTHELGVLHRPAHAVVRLQQSPLFILIEKLQSFDSGKVFVSTQRQPDCQTAWLMVGG
jgi:hypothetical protein